MSERALTTLADISCRAACERPKVHGELGRLLWIEHPAIADWPAWTHGRFKLLNAFKRLGPEDPDPPLASQTVTSTDNSVS